MYHTIKINSTSATMKLEKWVHPGVTTKDLGERAYFCRGRQRDSVRPITGKLWPPLLSVSRVVSYSHWANGFHVTVLLCTISIAYVNGAYLCGIAALACRGATARRRATAWAVGSLH